MNEKEFVIKKREYWQELATLLQIKKKSFHELRRMGKLYQQTAEDLSYAQTHFPQTDVSRYLNQLIRNCHMVFQRPRKTRFRRFFYFLHRGFPEIIIGLWKPILISALLFIFSTMTAFIMVTRNVELAEMFLDSRTYDMVRSDLESREKFSNFDNIDKTERVPLSLYIWVNNSKVSLLCFVLGVTAGVGTVYILISNGFMLGSLMAVYYMNGHFNDFYTLIMIHGSIELIAIMIAGGAGLSLAVPLLFPGRQRRGDLLKQTALVALKCLGGVVLLLLWAGLVEGLVTPMKLMIPLRRLIIIGNLVILVLYFLRGLPRRKNKPEVETSPENPKPLFPVPVQEDR